MDPLPPPGPSLSDSDSCDDWEKAPVQSAGPMAAAAAAAGVVNVSKSSADDNSVCVSGGEGAPAELPIARLKMRPKVNLSLTDTGGSASESPKSAKFLLKKAGADSSTDSTLFTDVRPLDLSKPPTPSITWLVKMVLCQLRVPIPSTSVSSSKDDSILMLPTVSKLARLLSLRSLSHDLRLRSDVLNALISLISKYKLTMEIFDTFRKNSEFSEPTLSKEVIRIFKTGEELVAFLNLCSWFQISFNLDLFADETRDLVPLTETSMIKLLIQSTNFCELTLFQVMSGPSNLPGAIFRNILHERITYLKLRKLDSPQTLLDEMNNVIGIITVNGMMTVEDQVTISCPNTLGDFLKMVDVLSYGHCIVLLSDKPKLSDTNRVLFAAFQCVIVTFGLKKTFPPACCFSRLSPSAKNWLTDTTFISNFAQQHACLSAEFASKPTDVSVVKTSHYLSDYLDNMPRLFETDPSSVSKLVAGGTGSGKTTIYTVCVFLALLKNPNSLLILVVPSVTRPYVLDLLKGLIAIMGGLSDEAKMNLPSEYTFLRTELPRIYDGDKFNVSVSSLKGIVVMTGLSAIPPLLASVVNQVQAGGCLREIRLIVDDPSTDLSDSMNFMKVMKIIANYKRMPQMNVCFTLLSATIKHSLFVDSRLCKSTLSLPIAMFQPSGSESHLLSVVHICRILPLICDALKSEKKVSSIEEEQVSSIEEEQVSRIELLKLTFFTLGLPTMTDIINASKLIRSLCSQIKGQEILKLMNMLPFDGLSGESIPLMLMKSINKQSTTTLVLGLDNEYQTVLDEIIERVMAMRLKDPSDQKKKAFKKCSHGNDPELCANCMSGNDEKSSSPAPTSSRPKLSASDETANCKERPGKGNRESRTSAMNLVTGVICRLFGIDTSSINLLVEITWHMELSIPFDVMERLVTYLAIGIYPALMIEQLGIGSLVKSHINSLFESKHITVILLARSSDPILGLNLQDTVNVFILNNPRLTTHHVTQVSGRVGRRKPGSLDLSINPCLFDMRQSVERNCDPPVSLLVVDQPVVSRTLSFFGTKVPLPVEIGGNSSVFVFGTKVPLPFIPNLVEIGGNSSVFGSDSAKIQLLVNTTDFDGLSLSLMKNIVSIFNRLFKLFLNPDDTTRWAVYDPTESWGITGLITNILIMSSTSFQMPYAGDKKTGAEIPILFFSSELASKRFKSVFPKKENQTSFFDAFRKIIRDACRLVVDRDQIVQFLPFFQATSIISSEFDGLSIGQVQELGEIIKGLLRLLGLILRTYTTRSKMYVFINEVYEWLLHYRDKLNVRSLATLDFEKKSRPLPPVDAFIHANPADEHVSEMKEWLRCLGRARRAFFLSGDPSKVEALQSEVSKIECKIAELRSLIECKILSWKNASTVASFFNDYARGLLALATPLPGLCAHPKLLDARDEARDELKCKRNLFRDLLKLIPLNKADHDSDTALMNDITRKGGMNWNGTAREARKMVCLQIGCLESLCRQTFSVVIDGVEITVRVNTPLKEIQQTAREFEACFCELEQRGNDNPEEIQAMRDRISALLLLRK